MEALRIKPVGPVVVNALYAEAVGSKGLNVFKSAALTGGAGIGGFLIFGIIGASSPSRRDYSQA